MFSFLVRDMYWVRTLQTVKNKKIFRFHSKSLEYVDLFGNFKEKKRKFDGSKGTCDAPRVLLELHKCSCDKLKTTIAPMLLCPSYKCEQDT